LWPVDGDPQKARVGKELSAANKKVVAAFVTTPVASLPDTGIAVTSGKEHYRGFWRS
jgi:hypothetical protein